MIDSTIGGRRRITIRAELERKNQPARVPVAIHFEQGTVEVEL